MIDYKSSQEENKMGIDKETQPSYINITLDNNPAYMKLLKDQAEEDGQNDEKNRKLSLTTDKHSFQMEEYYFDDNDDTILISGKMVSDKGKSDLLINIPLSDTILIDILQYATKKLNKLQTALETLS